MVTEGTRSAGVSGWQDPAARDRTPTDGRSAADLARDLTEQAATLVRQEIQLARLEMTEKAIRWGRQVAYIVVGALVGYAGLLAIIQAAINGLGMGIWRGQSLLWLAVWLAPLMVGLLVIAAGYAFVRKGISSLKRDSVFPEKTLATMRENKQWLEDQVK
jgi:hypothetical protein